MAKKKKQDPISVLNAADLKHYRDTEKYVKIVDRLYKDAISDVSQLAAKVGAIPATDQFSFSKNPAISQQVDAVIQKLASRIQAVIETGDREQWDAACAKSVAFLGSIMRTSAIPKPLLQSYQDRNLESLAAFQERKINGLGLSERVWSYVSPLKQEVESVADTTKAYINNGINTPGAMEKVERAIGTGMSADDLSREVRSCLKEPNKLFRRIRDKYGNLHLSKNAKLYHPGQGVYRSSYKNAKRMTRSEINMAYRQSDHLRWQQLDFVVGQRVQLSGNHTCLGKDGKPHPFYDICDILQGDYPKDAKLVGWHPQCRCIVTPIIKPYDEWNEDRKYLDEKAYRQLPASNEVTDVPQAFKDYIRENQKRIAGWTSTPYYIKDNPHYVDKAINPGKYKSAIVLTQEQRKQLEDFRMYAYNHQGSKKFGTALDNALESQLAGDQKAYEASIKTMSDVQKTNDRVHNYLQEQKKKPKTAPPDPAQLRKQYDDQIDMLRKNADRYGIDMNAIDEAYVSLDLKRLKKVLDEQQKVLDEGMARKKKIWDAADRRHAARTPEKEAALKDFAREHKAKTESVYKQIDEAIANAKGINEADVSVLKDLKSGKAGSRTTKAGKTLPTATLEKLQKEAQKLEKIVEEYNTAMNEAKALVGELKGISDVDTETVLKSTSIKGVKDGIKKLQDVKDKISKLSTLDNPLQVAKDFSLADAVSTHNAVVKKIKEWETKYSTDSYLQKTTTQNEYLAKKLKYEINEHFGKESVQQKYKTWAVAQSAYAKKLVAVEKEIWASKASEKLAEIEAFSKAHPTSKILANKFAEAQKALLDKDQTLFEQCYTEAQLKDKALNKRAKKKVPEGDVVFNESCFSKERKTKAKQFHTDESSQEYFYNNARENYANADRGTRQAAENYTHNSGYLTKPARALSGFYEREASYAAKAAKDMQLLTDYIRQSSFEHDVWVSREERMAFLVLKTGGLDGDTLMKNVEEYAKKARVKYKGKKTKAEIDALIKRYKKHEESQMIGRKGVDPSIVSTSANLDQRFSGTGGDNKYGKPKVHLEIFCPKGTQAVYADPYSHYTHSVKGPDGFWDAKTKPSNTSENEIFLQQHTEYRILEARYVESEDKWYVKAEVVAQRPRNVKGYVYDADEGGYKLDFE